METVIPLPLALERKGRANLLGGDAVIASLNRIVPHYARAFPPVPWHTERRLHRTIMSLPPSPAEELQHRAQPSLASSDSHDIFSQAITPAAGQRRPGQQTLTRALLDQERQAKQQKWTMAMEDLLGTWQLYFTAPGKPTYKAGQPTGQGFYVPGLMRATLGFSKETEHPTGLIIQNQLQIALLKLRFTGPARVLPQKKSGGI